MRIPTFYVSLSDINASSAILKGVQARHLKLVMRLMPGSKINLIDGTGRIYKGVVRGMKDEGVDVGIIDVVEVQSSPFPRIALAQALPRGRKMDLIVRKATELGVWAIFPIISERSVTRLNSMKPEKRISRWKRIIEESAKQSVNANLPLLYPIVEVGEFLKSLPDLEIKLIFSISPNHLSLRQVMRRKNISKGVIVMVGPEGGFSTKEIESAGEANFITCSLGRRVLRVETASLTILSILQYELGGMDG